MAAPKQEKPIIVALTLDFETGGLYCQTDACTQIAVHATRLDTFERIGTFVRYIKPYAKKEIKGVSTGKKKKVLKTKYEVEEKEMMGYGERAFEVSGLSMEILEEKGDPLETVAADLIQFITDVCPKVGKSNKPFIIGQNIPFDEGFLCQMMEYAGLMKEFSKVVRGHEDFYGNWHPDLVDTIPLAQLALCNRDDIVSYKLELICEKLGIELDDAHDADADVSATTNVVAVLTQRMRNASGESGEALAVSKTEKTRKHFKI